jgi:uncharacterized protein (TIGR00730 family)
MKRVCIFCGSSHGVGPAYDRPAHEIGVALAERGLGLVYGGGNVGPMGVVADAVLGRGDKAVGIIPQALVDKQLAHQGLTELHMVHSMHERKALMAELAGAFIALPGSYGTLEEFCEIITWTELGLHHKPSGLLNVDGFYDPFLAQIDSAVKAGFIRKEYRSLILVGSEPRPLIDRLLQSRPPSVPKWIASDET